MTEIRLKCFLTGQQLRYKPGSVLIINYVFNQRHLINFIYLKNDILKEPAILWDNLVAEGVS